VGPLIVETLGRNNRRCGGVSVELVVQMCGNVRRVGPGATDVARSATPQHAAADGIDAGRLADDATVMLEPASPIEDVETQPRVVGPIAGGKQNSSYP